MKIKEIKEKYNKLLNDVKTKDFYKIDLTNRVNCYICKNCGHITKTKDIDAGVTPFMFNCENCDEFAYSRFYNDVAPELKPTFEWYRPTLKELLKMHPVLQEHILNGGLHYRKINY